MSCRLDSLKLVRYFDGESSPNERAEVQRHIQTCPECSELLDVFGNSADTFALLQKVEMTPQDDARFADRLDEALEKTKPAAEEEYGEPVVSLRGALEDILARLVPPVPVPVRVAVAAALVLLVALGSYVQLGPQPTVFYAKGQVEIRKSGTDVWQPLESGITLAKGDRIRTQDKAQADIVVTKRFGVRLKPDSEAEIRTVARNRIRPQLSVRLDDGVILASTLEGYKNAKLLIATSTAEAQITATKFMVNAFEERSTVLAVLEGRVAFVPVDGREGTVVGAGEQSTIIKGQAPTSVSPITPKHKRLLNETNYLARPPMIVSSLGDIWKYSGDELVAAVVIGDIPEGASRARRVLKPFYYSTNDREPLKVLRLLRKGLVLTIEGNRLRDYEMKMKAVNVFEGVIRDYPDDRYNAQLLTYLAMAYHALDQPETARERFQEVVNRYPESELASIAQTAVGIMEEEVFHDPKRARDAYQKVLTDYPSSPEAEEAEVALNRLTP